MSVVYCLCKSTTNFAEKEVILRKIDKDSLQLGGFWKICQIKFDLKDLNGFERFLTREGALNDIWDVCQNLFESEI